MILKKLKEPKLHSNGLVEENGDGLGSLPETRLASPLSKWRLRMDSWN